MERGEILKSLDIINDSVSYYEDERPFLSTGNLNVSEIEDLEYYSFGEKPSRANLNVKEGDLIVARMKDTLKVKKISSDDEDIMVSTGFLVLRAKENLDNQYLYHILKSSDFQRDKNKLCTGATQKAINNANFAKIKIPLPELSVQKKIAAILDQAQEIRETNQQIVDKYEQLKQSLFLDMFGDPVKNEKRWEVRKISDVAKKSKGSMRTGPFGSDLLHSEFVNEGISVLGIDNAVLNRFEWKNRRYISEEKYEKLKRYTVQPYDVIITIMGTIGRVAVVPENIGKAINTKHLAAISFNQEVVDPYFMAFLLHSDENIKRQLKQKGRGAIMTGLNLSIIKELKFWLPPIEIQKKFVEITKSIDIQIETAEQSLQKSDSLFNALLQKAFSGNLIKN